MPVAAVPPSVNTDQIARNHPVSLGLIVLAWMLYLASLVLPCIDLCNVSTGKATGDYGPGWIIVLYLLVPFFWPAGTFLYLLVNVCFWISPFLLPLRRFQGVAYTVYPVLLGLSTIIAWSSAALVCGVSFGFFAWGSSLTTALIAFCLPMSRLNAHDSNADQANPLSAVTPSNWACFMCAAAR